MKKMVQNIVVCFLLAAFFWCGMLLSDRCRLRQELIRLHVVANSDSSEDQFLKLQVRDAVVNSMRSDLEKVSDVRQAEAYLEEKLPSIQKLASDTLQSLGCNDAVTVSLCQEAFDTRYYDTFTLPAGIYNALRIVIGDGAGANWWCVAFPGLCIPTTSEGIADIAAAAGFPASLSSTLTGEEGYELRFAILDMMGKLENILFGG